MKHSGKIKMWIWLCVEKGSYLGFRNRAGMRKIGRNIVRQKKVLREKYMYGYGSESLGSDGEG